MTMPLPTDFIVAIVIAVWGLSLGLAYLFGTRSAATPTVDKAMREQIKRNHFEMVSWFEELCSKIDEYAGGPDPRRKNKGDW